MKGVYLIVICFVLMGMSKATENNGQSDILNGLVKIPRAMCVSDFDYYFEGKTLFEVYLAIGFNPPNDVVIKPEIKFTKIVNRTYERVLIGVTKNAPTTCNRSSYTADLVEGSDRMMLYINDTTDFLQMFYSSSPEQYVWFLRCLNWVAGNKCALQDVSVGLLLTSIEDTTSIPWDPITKDLEKTGLSFGEQELFIFITYGKNELCTF